MARRSTKLDAALLTLLLVVGIPLFAISKLFESTGVGPGLGLIASGIAVYWWYTAAKRKRRRAELVEKYQSNEIAERIMQRMFWEGQTAEQLTDSLGKPSAIDDHILKTKKKQVWKYDHQGSNRYGLRITLENDYVVGWDKRS